MHKQLADNLDQIAKGAPRHEVETVDAVSTIRLLQSIEAFYPMLALIHVFLDRNWKESVHAAAA